MIMSLIPSPLISPNSLTDPPKKSTGLTPKTEKPLVPSKLDSSKMGEKFSLLPYTM